VLVSRKETGEQQAKANVKIVSIAIVINIFKLKLNN